MRTGDMLTIPLRKFDEIKREVLSGNINYLLTRYSDLILVFFVASIIGMLIVPLKPFLLDMLLTLNIAFAVTILLVSIYIPEALKLAAFPTILLITTLFRLGLEVSATRLILLYADAGHVIRAFGNFVVGGNYVVGAVIFLIITLVQFIVIAKGAERVAEVAARFTLDAMPGKQMSIDADLRAGIINMEEAKRRRGLLERESQLYGSMDGAMKFVKGDAIAGIVITLINIIGGLAIGVLQRDMELQQAVQTYTILTIGNGLVAQIPALIISLSAGMVVTRVSSESPESNLGRDIGEQILARPKAIGITSALLLVLGLVPGLPGAPFFLLSLITGAIAYSISKTQRALIVGSKQQAAIGEGELVAARELKPSEATEKGRFLPYPTPLSLEVSEGLTPLVDAEKDGGRFINEMIPMIRDALFYELGVAFPGVRVLGNNPTLEPDAYVIKINEVPVARGTIRPGYCLVNASVEDLSFLGIEAEEALNPADDIMAAWIRESDRERVQSAGFTVWDGPGYMLLHLMGVMRRHASEFVGIQEVKLMLDQVEQYMPALVKEVVPRLISIPQLTEVLKRLVEEEISIRDIKSILEALADWGQVEKDPVMLTERVRSHLRRYITYKYAGDSYKLVVYLIDSEIEEMIRDSIQHTSHGSYLALDPNSIQEILAAVRKTVGYIRSTSQRPVILTSMDIRRYVRKLVETDFPRLAVLSYEELLPEASIQPIGSISLDRPQMAEEL